MTNTNIIIHNLICLVNKNKGSSLLLPAYGREGQGQHLFNWRRFSRSEKRNSAAAKARAGREEKGVWGKWIPAPPERSVLASAARSAAIIRDFAQKRFALRSVIATNLNIANFEGSLFARLPRLFFGGIGGRISQSEMRRQKRCCPCPNPPVRGQRQGTP